MTAQLGQTVNVRILQYKSFRHYGGREISTSSVIAKATYLEQQKDGTYLVSLSQDAAGHKLGCKIAIQENNFNI